MQMLRQSTQVIVRVGPFVDVGDGFTPQTDITLGGNEAELLKSASVEVDISGRTWAAVTNCRGWYDLTLTTDDTDTVGLLTVVVQDDSDCLPVFRDFQVIEEAVYDELYKSAATGINAACDTAISDYDPPTDTEMLAAHITTDALITTVDGVVDTILVDTAELQTDDIPTKIASVQTEVDKIDIAQADLDIITGASGVVIQNDTITAAKLGADCITNAKIADDAIAVENIKDAAITADKIAADAITSAKYDESTAFPVSSGMKMAGGTIVEGTVSHDNTASSTTVFYSDDIIEATADHYNGRIVIFTSGALIYQATDITDYALVSGEGKFTVTALTEAPADNVTFVIV